MMGQKYLLLVVMLLAILFGATSAAEATDKTTSVAPAPEATDKTTSVAPAPEATDKTTSVASAPATIPTDKMTSGAPAPPTESVSGKTNKSSQVAMGILIPVLLMILLIGSIVCYRSAKCKGCRRNIKSRDEGYENLGEESHNFRGLQNSNYDFDL